MRLLFGFVVVTLLVGGSLLVPPRVPDLAREAVVADRDGTPLRVTAYHTTQGAVRPEHVSPHVLHALVATEDRRFWEHDGVDVRALARATWANLQAGRVVSGGSTLSMQAARLLRERTGRASLFDKLLETHLALRLELHGSKDDILRIWLSRAPFGGTVRGIEAAAQTFFGKSARDLSLAEAALLVGLPQSPSRYHPWRHPERARARQRRVLEAMHAEGHISAADVERLAALPLPTQPAQQTFRAPHLAMHLVEGGGLAAALGRPAPDVAEVRTTLNPALQRDAEGIVRTHLDRLREHGGTQAAAVVLDNATGEVLAYVGSADFWGESGQNDGPRQLRQPGSALKPFTYALALASRRYTAASVLPDLPLQVQEAGGAFSPANYDGRFHGPVPLREALACSYNVPAVRLVRDLGPDALLRLLRRAGFASLTEPADHYGVGLTLGSGEVRLVELARAYAALARGGTAPPLRTIRFAVTATGDTLRPADAPTLDLGLHPHVVAILTDILSDDAARAPAFGRGGPLALPFPVAAKTGTSKDYRDNWTAGFTPRHTVAVWAGNFDAAPMQDVSGVSGAAPIFHALMLRLGSGGAFGDVAGLEHAHVCPSSGKAAGRYCPAPREERFLPGTAPTAPCDVHRRLAIDRATGRRAAPDASPATVDTLVAEVLPPAYHAWLRDEGRWQPYLEATPEPEHVPTERAAFAAPLLHIDYPADGTTFQRDPILREGFQQVHLRGTVSDDVRDLRWLVDDVPLNVPFAEARWPLTPGTHVLRLEGRRRGEPVQSDLVVVHVLP